MAIRPAEGTGRRAKRVCKRRSGVWVRSVASRRAADHRAGSRGQRRTLVGGRRWRHFRALASPSTRGATCSLWPRATGVFSDQLRWLSRQPSDRPLMAGRRPSCPVTIPSTARRQHGRRTFGAPPAVSGGDDRLGRGDGPLAERPYLINDDPPSGPAVREQTEASQRADEAWKACLVAWEAYRRARDGY